MQLRLEQPPPDVPHLVLQHLVLVQQPVGRRTEPSSRARAAAEPRYRVSSARCTVHQALKTRLGPRVPVGEVGILETVQLLPRGGKRDFRESMLWRATSGLISREPSIAVDSKDFRRASSLPTRSAFAGNADSSTLSRSTSAHGVFNILLVPLKIHHSGSFPTCAADRTRHL